LLIKINNAIENIYKDEIIFRAGRHRWVLGKRILIMGVLNVTPDSFYDGGRYFKKADAGKRALQMIEEGADIIDIGGESSRPGSGPVSLGEEIKRVIPVKRWQGGAALPYQWIQQSQRLRGRPCRKGLP